jgi:hypothetical protein
LHQLVTALDRHPLRADQVNGNRTLEYIRIVFTQVITAGGHRNLGTKSGDYVQAYTLAGPTGK